MIGDAGEIAEALQTTIFTEKFAAPYLLHRKRGSPLSPEKKQGGGQKRFLLISNSLKTLNMVSQRPHKDRVRERNSVDEWALPMIFGATRRRVLN